MTDVMDKTKSTSSWYGDNASALELQYAEYWADDEREARQNKQFKKGYRRTHKRREWGEDDNGDLGSIQ